MTQRSGPLPRLVISLATVSFLAPTTLARPEPDKPADKQPDREPQPPTDMPTPPLDQVGEPGTPAPQAPDQAPAEPPAKQPRTDAPASTPPVLSGPAVGDAAIPRLTRRDFAGRIRRLDIFPGEAALDFLKVDHRTDVRVKAIVAERTAILDRIVRDNVELVVRINEARQKGDNSALPTLGRQFREAASELTSRGSTAEEVLSILPPDMRDDYRRMLDSYWNELREQMLAEAKQRGETTTFRQIIDREVDRIWAGEIRRSYERQVGQREVNYEDALAALDLDEPTLAKCRDEIQLVVAKRPKLGPDERRDLFSRIYKLLDIGRQTRFTAYVLSLPPVKERSIEELAASLPPPAQPAAPKPKDMPKDKPKDAKQPDSALAPAPAKTEMTDTGAPPATVAPAAAPAERPKTPAR